MELSSFLTWLQGIGFTALALVVAAGLLKLAGADFLWNIGAKIIDWLFQGFQWIILAAPGPVKVLIFLMLLSTIGSLVIPVTIGVYGVCHNDDLYVTDDYFEGLAANLIPLGEEFMGSTAPIIVRDDTANETIITGQGPLVDQRDFLQTYRYPGGVYALVMPSDGYLDEEEWVGSSNYAVCFDERDNQCYVRRPSSQLIGGEVVVSRCAAGAEDADANYVILGSWYYETRVEGSSRWADNDDALAAFPRDVRLGSFTPFVGAQDNGGSTDWQSINSCPTVPSLNGDNEVVLTVTSDQVSTSTQVASSIGTLLNWLITFGIRGDLEDVNDVFQTQVYSGYVHAAYGEVVASSEDLRGARSISLKNDFLNRDKSSFEKVSQRNQKTTIQYVCDGEEKDITLLGLPVFDPAIMFLMIVIGALIVFIVRR